ncbi:MAG: hemolysin III family protein [Muricauda sp.]|nr:hemolysin III family protein [Allomuricauda sp.]
MTSDYLCITILQKTKFLIPKKDPVLIEEKWNAYSHGLGIVLASIGGYVLLQNNVSDVPYLKNGLLVYAISVVILFTASTVYHAVQNPKIKKRLRILDHISIYYLIAGTYTPVCLTVLLPSKGWLLFYLVWGIALFGTILKIFFTGKFEAFSLVLYGVMGWLIVMDLPYLTKHMSTMGLFYLSLGGAFYTIGILFYAIKKIPYNHLIWHFFVLGGAIGHWWLIYSLIQ